jgi:metallo-beta-lactamase class B
MQIKRAISLVSAWFLLISSALMADDSVPANWVAPIKPFHVAGPIFYVGTKGLGVYLVKSSSGLIVLSGAMPQSTELIRNSILALGFKLEDVRLLLVSHAHIDHVGTLAAIKKLTGGSVVAMSAEEELLKSGGKADYLFGGRENFHFGPVSPDRLIEDGETVSLGNIQMTAHWTPGHTRGCTTWEMTVDESGRKYDVVFLDGTSVNPGTRFTKNPSYPGITNDYQRTFATLESLHPDIFLSYHAEAFDLEQKSHRAEGEGVKAWVDSAGYRNRVSQSKANFEKMLRD